MKMMAMMMNMMVNSFPPGALLTSVVSTFDNFENNLGITCYHKLT